MWLDDVLPQATIRSVWGNSVRDRIVQTFDTMAEANSHLSVLPDGATCYVAATQDTYVRRAGVWRALSAKLVSGVTAADISASVGTTVNLVTLSVPAGYRQALFVWRIYATPVQADWDYAFIANLYVDGGATNVAIGRFGMMKGANGLAAPHT